MRRPLARQAARSILPAIAAAVLWLPAGLPASAPGPVAAQGLRGQPRQRAVSELAAGKLLVAARNLPDPNFADAVVLLTEFTAKAAVGLIVNRPTDVPLSEMLPNLDEARGRRILIFFGGPVAERGALALMRSTSSRRETRHVVDDVYLVSGGVFGDLIESGAGPDRFRVYVGYAGWGPGQLDGETAGGSWHVVDGDGGVVFDPDALTLWQRLIRRVEARSAD